MTFGAETSSVEVTIYHKDRDPILWGGLTSTSFGAPRDKQADNCIFALSTNKTLTGEGTWSLKAKFRRGGSVSLLNSVADDDWIDIVLLRQGKRWHALRGLVKQIALDGTVNNGATTEVVTLSGTDHQRVWADTPIWFNRYQAENVAGATLLKMVSALDLSFITTPDATVRFMLFDMLRQMGVAGRANWKLPPGMPGVSGSFVDELDWRQDFLVSRKPHRVATLSNFMEPEASNIWALAQSWSDPDFCELFTDLIPSDPRNQGDGIECPVGSSRMTVVFRDRPWPTQDGGISSYWFGLPTYTVLRQEIATQGISRSGYDRFNAYFAAPQYLIGTNTDALADMMAPLWNRTSIEEHGLRRMDVNTRYISPEPPWDIGTPLRKRLLELHCLNPYLWGGSLALAHGRPEIKVGCRVRVPGTEPSGADQQTYYVEGVQNQWTFGQGIRTTLALGRGWIGSDADLLQAMDLEISQYEGPPIAVEG